MLGAAVRMQTHNSKVFDPVEFLAYENRQNDVDSVHLYFPHTASAIKPKKKSTSIQLNLFKAKITNRCLSSLQQSFYFNS